MAEDFTALAAGRADADLLFRPHRRTALLPDRDACRHPDGAARLAASALSTFAEDVERHLTHDACQAARRPPLMPVPPATPPGGMAMTRTRSLRIDRIACTGQGLCAELLPELIDLDEWGYPVVKDRAVPDRLHTHARRAVGACPLLALRIEDTEP